MEALKAKVAGMIADLYPFDYSNEDIAEILADKTKGELLNMIAEISALMEED